MVDLCLHPAFACQENRNLPKGEAALSDDH